MQKTIYMCDQCKKEIGTKKHISLVLTHQYSGIAVPPNKKKDKWTVETLLPNFVHFCGPGCIALFFNQALKVK